MKIKVILLIQLVFASLFVQPLGAQNADCMYIENYMVIAPSGMRMRSEPNLKSKVVTYVPKDSILQACEEDFGEMTYEDIKGDWLAVKYNGFKGYMFDGFLEFKYSVGPQIRAESGIIAMTDSSSGLSKYDSTAYQKLADRFGVSLDSVIKLDQSGISIDTTPQIVKEEPIKYELLTESFNYCGDIRALDPGIFWFAFYPNPDRQNPGDYEIRQVELEIIKSKYNLGKGLEFDVSTDQTDRSILLIGSKKNIKLSKMSIRDRSKELRYKSKAVFPGQIWNFSGSPTQLSATGQVLKAGDCPELKDYKLFVEHEGRSQNLSDQLEFIGECGMPDVYWYGDFTSDGIPELILVSVYQERNIFSLFVSDISVTNQVYTLQSQWIVEKCY